MKTLYAHTGPREGPVTTRKLTSPDDFVIDARGRVVMRRCASAKRIIGIVPNNATGRVINHRDGLRTTYQWGSL